LLSILLIISLVWNYDRIQPVIRNQFNRFFTTLFIIVIIGSAIGIMRGNHVANIFNDFRVFLGFLCGNIIALSFLYAKNGFIKLLLVYYSLVTIYLIHNYTQAVNFLSSYNLNYPMRVTDGLIFELIGYLILLTPIVLVLTEIFTRRILRNINIIIAILLLINTATINSTRSLTFAIIINLALTFIVIIKYKEYIRPKEYITKIINVCFLFIIGFFSTILLNKYLPFDLFLQTALSRWSDTQNMKTNQRFVELNDMFQVFDTMTWVWGNGFGALFKTNVIIGVHSYAPHISILTPLLKLGLIGFIILSIVPLILIIKNMIKYYKRSSRNIYAAVISAHAASLISFIVIYSLSGGWGYETMIIIGFSSFSINIQKKLKSF
jgi:hypothetical protein